ncbi:DUF6176 family protein [Microbacterium paludicola]|uniref:DUF6176 family protein n=1 Tax=Microbacterium paludicola TaxID=300019 RepID=UPI0031D6FF09
MRRIRPDQRAALEDWLRELNGPRRGEALATLAAEGVDHERAVILETSDGPVLIYAMESDDPARAHAIAAASDAEVDRRHREVLTAADAGRADISVALDLRIA